MTCPACGASFAKWDLFDIAWCLNARCSCWTERQDNGRWLIHIPSTAVPTSDWIECPACEGTGRWECATPWCTDDDHVGSCQNCLALGVVRGTLDHPTTPPPQETL